MHQDEECKAFILINVESGQDLQVFNRIRELQPKYPITEVSALYGDYDILVKVKPRAPGDLNDFIFNGLRSIPGIARTQTLIGAKCLDFK